MDIENKESLQKPTAYENPKCSCCGRKEDLRLGWCFECANSQAMLIDGKDMYDNDCSNWNKSEVLMFIVRKAMKL